MDYLAEVRRIVLEGLKGHAAKVYLYGSRARGDARRWSDVDVAVLPLVPYSVDLLDLSVAGDTLRDSVEREGVLWTA